MEVTFLGTGTSQGVPVIGCKCDICLSDNPKDKRLRTSILVKDKNTSLLVDTGPDFRIQALRENIEEIDAVLYTHEHRDHTAGLDDIRAYNFIHKKEMDLYASNRVQKALKESFGYIFEEHKYPGIPKVKLHDIDMQPFTIKDIHIIPIEVLHYKLPVLGFRFGDFTYITDANSISEKEKEKVKGTKVLVLNALRKKEHISHFTLDEAVSLSKELDAGLTFLTHMSHQIGLHSEVQSELPDNVFLAYDTLKVRL